MNDNKNVHSDDADLKDLINDYGSDEELRRKISEMKKQKEEQVLVQPKAAQDNVEVKKETSMSNIVADDVEKTMVAGRESNLEETLVIMDGKKNSYKMEDTSVDDDELGKTIVRPLHEIQEEPEEILEEEEEEEIEEEDEEVEEVEEETQEEKMKNEKKNKMITGVIIAIVAILVIGGIVFGVSKFMSKDDHKKPDDQISDVVEDDSKTEDVEDKEEPSDHGQSQDIAAKISALSKQKETYIIEKTKAEERLSNAEKELKDAKAELKALDKELLPKTKEAQKAVDEYYNGEYQAADKAYKEEKAKYDALDEAGKAEEQAALDEALARHEAAVTEFNRLSLEASNVTTDYHNQSKAIKESIDAATKTVSNYKSTIATLESQISEIEQELQDLQ